MGASASVEGSKILGEAQALLDAENAFDDDSSAQTYREGKVKEVFEMVKCDAPEGKIEEVSVCINIHKNTNKMIDFIFVTTKFRFKGQSAKC